MPPATVNAPVVVDVALVVALTLILGTVSKPLFAT